MVAMEPYAGGERDVLWRVASFGRQRVGRGQAYWWENASRQPGGRVVVQATLAGGIRYRDAVGEQEVTAGDLMMFAYGEASAYGQPDGGMPAPYVNQWVCLEGAGVFAHVTALRRRFGSVWPVGVGHGLFEDVQRLIDMAEQGAVASGTVMADAVHGFLMRLWEDAEQRRMQQLSPVQRAVDFVVRHPQLVMSVEAVAARFGCSREHMSRLFREQMGRSPNAYVNAEKTQRALRLLRNTDLPLSEVASQTGFASVKTMGRHIRRGTGWTSGQVRHAGGAGERIQKTARHGAGPRGGVR